MTTRLAALAGAGVSIWLDDLSRDRINSGNLASLISDSSVTGVTTNPTIFAAALADGEAYAQQMKELKASGASVAEAITSMTTTDVRDACDLFMETYRATDGVDGRVSIEVDPGLANDTDATVAQAAELHRLVDRENVLIKIPATESGIPAIRRTIAAGISVNVTLIFSTKRYGEVIDAYFSGLEDAKAAGIDISTIHSVASFFISRVDTEVDKRLAALGVEPTRGLTGASGIANARLAYEVFLKSIEDPRWEALAAAGGNLQRPLWASTGTKNPAYPDTLYVTELIAAHTVNTMPQATMDAFADHGTVRGDRVTGLIDPAHGTMKMVADAGVDFSDVEQVLETEGVEKFMKSWNELEETVRTALDEA